MPSIALYADENYLEPFDVVTLSDVEIREGDIGEGRANRVFARNIGDTVVRDITVGLKGEGAQFVQLAQDVDGQPNVWAAPGESIQGHQGSLYRQDGFSFWARGIFSLEDREDVYDFSFTIRGISTGTR